MEVLAGLIVLTGCGYIFFEQIALGFPPLIAGIVMMVGAILLLVEFVKTDANLVTKATGFRFRSHCGKGSYCSILIHTAVILSTFQDKAIYHQDIGPLVLVTYCLSVLVASLPVHIIGAGLARDLGALTLVLAVVSVIIGLTGLVWGVSASFGKLGLIEISVIVVMALWTVTIQCFLHLCLPRSFSLGEASIISHGLFLLFIFNHLLLHKAFRQHPVRPYTITAASDVTVFLQTAGGSSLAVVLALYFGPSLRNTVSFYGLVLGVAGAVATPLLIMALDKHFILWILEFVSKDQTRIKLFVYWGTCCVAAGLLLRWSSSKLQDKPGISCRSGGQKASAHWHDGEGTQTDSELSEESSEDEEGSCQGGDYPGDGVRDRARSTKAEVEQTCTDGAAPSKTQTSHNGMYTTDKGPTDRSSSFSAGCVTVARKYFHVFALAVFVPGMVADREMLMVAATCALVVFVLLECMRKIQVWPIGEVLDDWYGAFVDKRDSGPVILTHIYLILGCTIPLWLYPYPLEEGVHPALLSGLLSLGVGDTAASVVGTKWGMFRWPGTKKTVEGTLGAIVCQIIALAIFDHSGFMISVDWSIALAAIVLTSLVEAFTSQIDNLVLPLFMYTLLIDPLRTWYR